ncbi:MAG: endonuclease V [Candidatus Aminicenantes bacterium]|nr:endonuclease V [Candidatus Aminicenantes bacterium]
MNSKLNPESFLYPSSIREAQSWQEILARKIKIMPLEKIPQFIAAADASFLPSRVLAVACLFRFPELKLVETAVADEPLFFPYRPGFLSFCEGPAVFRAINSLKKKPELLLFDGQGIAHPRRLGLASFLGLLLETPSIGCAKSILVGDYSPPGPEAGSTSELYYRGEIVGYVLRSRWRVKPIIISPGHLIDASSALKIIISCLKGYRIPEPLRLAHQQSVRLKTLKK